MVEHVRALFRNLCGFRSGFRHHQLQRDNAHEAIVASSITRYRRQRPIQWPTSARRHRKDDVHGRWLRYTGNQDHPVGLRHTKFPGLQGVVREGFRCGFCCGYGDVLG